MNNVMILTCLIYGLAATVGIAQDKNVCWQVDKKYDRFKDETTLKLRPQRVLETAAPQEELDLSVEASHVGEQPARPAEIAFLFISTSEKWRYFEEAEILFVIDGKHLEAGKAYATDTSSDGRSIKEKLKLTLPVEKFEEIISSKKVEMKIGPTYLQLEEKHLLALREFMACVTGQR